MSAVERALKKLQGKAGASPVRSTPVGRVVAGESADARNPSLPTEPGHHVELDFEALQSAGLYSSNNHKLIDEYRLIKQPLLKKAADVDPREDERYNLIMVASSVAGEGKTFTSLNLSLSLASEKDWNVLLVDVDCKKPHLSLLLGALDRPGLLDVLKDPSLSVESLIMSTNVEGLTVLPLGSRDDNSSELLGSSTMSELCAHLSTLDPRRIVIFDSSPLLLTTEPAILSGQVGQVVMVVLADQTPRNAVLQAIDKLDHTKAIGVVLNRVDHSSDALGYGYAYGYGSGYGYGSTPPDQMLRTSAAEHPTAGG